jgi:hypothetical protein
MNIKLPLCLFAIGLEGELLTITRDFGEDLLFRLHTNKRSSIQVTQLTLRSSKKLEINLALLILPFSLLEHICQDTYCHLSMLTQRRLFTFILIYEARNQSEFTGEPFP